MKIAIDSDSVAAELKAVLVQHLRKNGVEVADLDYVSAHGGEYPDVGYNLARQIQAGRYDRGILLCGTGLGMAMIACKVRGVYAGTCHDVYSAQRLRASNDAQIITLGSRVVGPELAKTVVDAWLGSDFAGGGSGPKVERMKELEALSFEAGGARETRPRE